VICQSIEQHQSEAIRFVGLTPEGSRLAHGNSNQILADLNGDLYELLDAAMPHGVCHHLVR
jgi:hypothetical protein